MIQLWCVSQVEGLVIHGPGKYSMTEPFFYIISWTELDMHYAGIKFAKGCQPTDLWTKYFTSSTRVKKFRELHGEPDSFVITRFDDRQELIKHEQDFLQDKIHNKHWLNVRAASYNIHWDEEARSKISEANKRRLENGFVHQNLGKKRSPEVCLNISKGKRGSTTKLKGTNLTAEHKEKISKSLTGRKQSEESKSKRSKALKGRAVAPKSDETKAKIAETMRGRKLSPETIAKRTATAKRNREAKREN